jgi:Na+-translocating ferredoxin:NAD+ oxidoreductase RnfG subunit
MRRMKTIAVSLGVLAAVSLAPAHSQNQPTPSGISDQKLDQAAAAMGRVSSLHKSYQQKLEQTPPDKQDSVIAEANDALQKAVTDQGLSVDEYNTIVRTAQSDPAIREKLVQRLGAPKE